MNRSILRDPHHPAQPKKWGPGEGQETGLRSPPGIAVFGTVRAVSSVPRKRACEVDSADQLQLPGGQAGAGQLHMEALLARFAEQGPLPCR